MIITANSVTFTGEKAREFSRLIRAMKHLQRGLVMEPGGSYYAADGQPLPTEAQISEALDAAERSRQRSKLKPITGRQLRLWLHGAGLLDEVPAIIAALPEPQRTAAQIEWDWQDSWDRMSPLVIERLAPEFGMTSADLDLAWQHAARL